MTFGGGEGGVGVPEEIPTFEMLTPVNVLLFRLTNYLMYLWNGTVFNESFCFFFLNSPSIISAQQKGGNLTPAGQPRSHLPAGIPVLMCPFQKRPSVNSSL